MVLFGDYGAVFVMGLIGMGFAVPTLIIPRLLAPRKPNPIKNAPFECGQVPAGKGKMHFMMQYYAYLLMFVVFDVMAMFLYAWAAAYQPLALGALVELDDDHLHRGAADTDGLRRPPCGEARDLVAVAEDRRVRRPSRAGSATSCRTTWASPSATWSNWGRLYSLWPVHLETACCTPPDTVILGDNKPISSYKVGDSAVGTTGHVGVTQTFSRNFQGDLVEIRGRGMLPFFVTPEHPILTVRREVRSGKGEYSDIRVWKSAAELVPSPPVKKHGRYLYPTADHDCLLIPRIKGSVEPYNDQTRRTMQQCAD